MAQTYDPLPSGQDVAAFLGQPEDTTVVALAGEHVPIVTALARSYTRGNGFNGTTATEDLCAVITTATARLVPNPSGTVAEAIGTYSVRPGVFNGWTLAETFVLNRYRKRAL
ncbi:hypothetical protein [Segeticoccus rhizosphaerae]|uniref:hypothetical protein n=1 Tax=Segeticoccus rhizosphaerae TaxID=1104777 RepID=UPI0010C0C34F|nr:hypothetical protein [Ornithinicoccus soli]